MTIRELALTVKLMRDAQRDYFRDRSQENLQLAKKYEKQVDEMVTEALVGKNLFEKGD